MIILIEAFASVLVKIGLEPGVIVESKFKVIFVVFWNAIKESYLQVLSFRQVYFTKTIIVSQPGLQYGRIYLAGGCNMEGSITLPGYLKEPEHFKY